MNKINNSVCLYDFIKKQINPVELNGFCDNFDDFEIEIFDNEFLSCKFSRAAFITKNNNDFNKIFKIRIKNGLFTDSSGYCHKIIINKDINIEI